MNRRSFLSSGLAMVGGSRLLSAGTRPWPFAQSSNERTLVVLELRGGNDGLSTLVPYGDDEYYKLRKGTAWKPETLHKVDEYRGFHKDLTEVSKRFNKGEVAVFQGIGYPNPNKSHFKSREIWHTADLRGRAGNDGWLGRLCEQRFPDSTLPELSIHIGNEEPYSLQSSTHPPVIFRSPDTYRWLGDGDAEASLDATERGGKGSTLDRLRRVMTNAKSSSARILDVLQRYETPVEYPTHESSRSMRAAAALIHAGMGSRVISATFRGFDTHADQRFDHSNALGILDNALQGFLADLERSQAGRETLVLVTSEFGRRAQENGSRGTDHGKAGVALALGTPVKGGLFGEHPSLTELDNGDLAYNLDFRRLYATALEWMGADAAGILGAKYDSLPFV